MTQRYQLNANGPERSQVLTNAHAFIDRLPPKKSWIIEIKEARKNRSSAQNHALFGVAYPALERVTGYTKDELHHEFCGRYFQWHQYEILGELRSKPIRTTTINERGERDVIDSETFADFYAMVQRLGAEAGIDVPDPAPNGVRP